MAEESFPSPEKPMGDDQWSSVTRGIGNGILDKGGFPYNLVNFDNVSNTVELTRATLEDEPYSAAILEGFYHKLDENLTLSIPPVSSRTTYYVALQYDPVRAEEGGLPVVAGVWTKFDYTSGKNYLPLWNITRNANELLSAATVRMLRPRVAPTLVFASEDHLPLAHKTLWGTIAYIHNGRHSDNAKIMMALNTNASGNDDEGAWFWKTIYDPNADDFTYEWANRGDTGTYISPSHGYDRAIGRRGKRRKFRGRVARANGSAFNPGSTYQIWSGDLPASDKPASTQSFVTVCGNNNPTFARVELSGDGSVTARVSAKTYWIGLDGIEWEVK